MDEQEEQEEEEEEEEEELNNLSFWHRAALMGYTDDLELYLDEGADINASVDTEMSLDDEPIHLCTALMLAAWYDQEDVVELLLARGADVTLQDAGGRTAVHWACNSRTDARDSLALLVDNGADAKASDNYGLTPLMVAARSDSIACVVLLLLDTDADVEAKDDNGCTAMHWACRYGGDDLLSVLLDFADEEARDHHGITPLMAAVLSISYCCVKLLLEEADVDVDAEDEAGYKALLYAVQRSCPCITELLLEAGANPFACNQTWLSGIDNAKLYEDKEGFDACVALVKAAQDDFIRIFLLRQWRPIMDAHHVWGGIQSSKAGISSAENKILSVAPSCIQERVREGQPLPCVGVQEEERSGDGPDVAAVTMEALTAMVPDVFQELLDYLY